MATCRWIALLFLLVCPPLWLGVGPAAAADKKRTVLATEYDDARVGAESSKAVAAQMGLLGDEKLDALVQEIGQKLLRGVPRRGFSFEFHIVDQVEPNAFALPGGYIFISRGLLQLTNNEDELACVIGHEITHATQRHSATQQAIQRSANPLSMGYVRASRMAAYGRDMERAADQGGQKLCAAAGYDPMGMSTFLDNLGALERLSVGYTRGQSFFDSHPGSQERAAANAIRAGEMRWRRDPSLGDTRARLLEQTDGLPVGQRPETGMFAGESFFHPTLDFYIRFPPGWPTANTPTAVGASAPRGEAVVFLQADQPLGDAQEMAEGWAEANKKEQHFSVKESKPVKIGRLDSWRLRLEGGSRGGQIASYVTFVPYGELTWRITGVSLARDERKFLGRTLSAARSFRPLTSEEKSGMKLARMRIVTARRGETLSALGERSGNAWNVPTTAVNNAIFFDHRFEGGELVKVAIVEPWKPTAQ